MIKLMNSAMMPAAGRYELKPLTQSEFAAELRAAPFESYIGYPDTAQLIERIAGVPVPVSRAQTTLTDGDVMLIAKLRYRVAAPGDKGKFTPGAEDFEFFRATFDESGTAALYRAMELQAELSRLSDAELAARCESLFAAQLSGPAEGCYGELLARLLDRTMLANAHTVCFSDTDRNGVPTKYDTITVSNCYGVPVLFFCESPTGRAITLTPYAALSLQRSIAEFMAAGAERRVAQGD